MSIFKKSNNNILHKLYFQLAGVNILINMIQPCNQLVDTILTGRALGAQALEVYALFLPVNSFLLAVSCVLSKGVQITSSHMVGKGDFKKSNEAVSTAILVGIVIALSFSVTCFVFSKQMAHLLGAGELTESVSDYIRAYSIGITPAILLDMLMCLIQIEGRRRLAVLGSFCVLFVNAAGDIANICIFRKGVTGMAWATSVANSVTFIFLGVFFLTRSRLYEINLRSFSKKTMMLIFKNGFPSLAYYGSLVIRTAFMNMLIINTLGRDVLVSMLVFTNYGTIADVLIGGHSDPVLVMGGILYGEKDQKGAGELLKTSIISGIVMMLIAAVLTIGYSTPLAKVFLNEKDMAFVPQAGRALTLAAFYLIPDMISCIEKKYIQAIGNGMYTAVTNVIYNVICVCVIAVVLVRFTGFDGLFLSFTGCYIIAAIVNSVYIIFCSFKRFKTQGENVTVYTVRDIDECIRVSERIHKYCNNMGIEPKRSYYLGLFTEEIGKNILAYGFKKERNNSIIIKVMILGDRITMSIKDDCVLFDPTHYYDTMRYDPENAAGGIGIRMMMELSENVVYTTGFNLNNLLIEV